MRTAWIEELKVGKTENQVRGSWRSGWEARVGMVRGREGSMEAGAAAAWGLQEGAVSLR